MLFGSFDILVYTVPPSGQVFFVVGGILVGIFVPCFLGNHLHEG